MIALNNDNTINTINATNSIDQETRICQRTTNTMSVNVRQMRPMTTRLLIANLSP